MSNPADAGADAVDVCQLVVPEGDGLLICLDGDGTVCFRTEKDQHYPHIHPNCHAPASLAGVHLLHGGGSGTAVFHGYHRTTAQSIVMKHGNSKDTVESLSLATSAPVFKIATTQQRT